MIFFKDNQVTRLISNSFTKKPKLIIFYLFVVVFIGFVETSIVGFLKPLFLIIENPESLKNFQEIFELKTNANLSYKKFIFYFFLIFALLFLTSFFLNITSFYISSNVREFFYYEWKKNIFEKYLNEDIYFFKNNHSGDLIQRLMVHTREASSFIFEFAYILRELVMAISIYIFLMYLSIEYTIYVTCFGLLIFFITYYLGKKIIILKTNKRNEAQSESFSIAELIIKGAEVIKSFKKEDYFKKIFLKKNKIFGHEEVTITTISQLPASFQRNLVFIIILITVYITLDQNITNSQSSLLIIFFAGFYKINNSFGAINNAILTASKLYPSLKIISKEMDLEKKITTPVIKNLSLFEFKKNFIVEKLNHSYENNNKTTIKNLNITIYNSKVHLIVGPSGCGKTTLAGILSGHLKFNGKLSIDDSPVKANFEKINFQDCSYLSQENVLFPGTIKDNIVFFDEKIDEKKFKDVIKLCMLGDLMEEISSNRGIDEFIYNKLSGGQRQRIFLARTIYSNKRIIILDEAISNIEKNLEKKIIDGLLEYFKTYKKTSIIISHSLKNFNKADKIYVMGDGKIIQHGNYDSLFNKEGYYQSNI